MSLLSQLVDPLVLVKLDQAEYGRLEAITAGAVLKEADSRKRLEATVDTMIKAIPKEPK